MAAAGEGEEAAAEAEVEAGAGARPPGPPIDQPRPEESPGEARLRKRPKLGLQLLWATRYGGGYNKYPVYIHGDVDV